MNKGAHSFALPPREQPINAGNFGSSGTQGITRARTFSARYGVVLLLAADLVFWIVALYQTIYLLHYSTLDFWFIAASPFIVVSTLYLFGGYDKRSNFQSLSYISEHLISLFFAAICSILFIYLFSAYHVTVKPSRLFLPVVFGLFTVPSIFARRWIAGRWKVEQQAASLLVVGDGESAQEFYRDYTSSELQWNLEFVAPQSGPSGVRIDGMNSPIIHTDADGVLARAEERYVGILLACEMPEISPAVFNRLVQIHCADVPVLTVESFHEEHWRKVKVESVGPEWIFASQFRLARGTVFSHLKRLFDIGLSFCALIVLGPFLFLLGLCIRLETSGAAIFRQDRVGREGRVFTMLKFRTMRENTGSIYTTVGDDRITKMGRWLRLTRIDELPQLWNVLRGEMSLIGPRAEWVKCAEIYEQQIPNYHLRHLVSPGITGWAQVNFRYGASESDAVEKFQYDLYYIRHFSLKLDLSIVIKTIYTMLSGGGR